MRRLHQLFLVGAVFAANGLVAACSGDSSQSDAGPDVSVPKDAGKDVVKPDAGDGAVTVITPAGTQLFSSDAIQVFGITTDDQVIFSDNGSGAALYAADANGTGTAVQIAAPTVSSAATYIVGIAGKVVFLWEGISTAKNAAQVGKLSTWTKAGGFKAGITLKSCASTGFASNTAGTKIMYSANSDTACATGDIVGANTDGTSPAPLQTTVDIAATTCAPQLGFAGGVNPVTSACTTAPPDGGAQVALVASYDATTWAKHDILGNAESFWASDTAGDKLMVSSSAAGIQVFPIAGGNATTIDGTNFITAGAFGYMHKDGNTVFYATVGGDLYTSPTGTPAPTKIQTGGVKFVRSISPDDKYLIYTTAFDSKQFGSDLYLRTTNTSDAAVTLVGTTTGALFGLNFNDDFTTDSTHALFIENADTTQFIGDLMSVPVTGGQPTKIASAEWLNLSALGSKIVFNDNCQGCGVNSNNQVIGTADIKAVDVSTTNAPAMLQAGADPQIYVPPTSKSHVVYTFSQNPPGAAADGGPLANGNGLWTVAIP